MDELEPRPCFTHPDRNATRFIFLGLGGGAIRLCDECAEKTLPTDPAFEDMTEKWKALW